MSASIKFSVPTYPKMVPGVHGEIGAPVSQTADQQGTGLVTIQHHSLEELTVLATILRRQCALEMIVFLNMLDALLIWT